MPTPGLDMFVGGILPHVRIKKFLIEDDPSGVPFSILFGPDFFLGEKSGIDARYKVTVYLELYQRKDEALSKSWLNDMPIDAIWDGAPAGSSLLDFFSINLIAVQSPGYISMLRKSNPLPNKDDAETWSSDKSIFLHKALAGDADPWSDVDCFNGGLINPNLNKIFTVQLPNIWKLMAAGEDLSPDSFREEVYGGHAYYVISIPFTFWMAPTQNLGIAAYTSFNIGDALSLNVEGSISAEVVMKNGSIAQAREVFVDMNGRPWSGPVHYHGPQDLPPGEFSPLYMTGERMSPDLENKKLEVIKQPNNLVYDFTDPNGENIPDFPCIGPGPGAVICPDAVSNIGPNYKKIEKELGIILSPFQKKAKTHFLPDNDSEYSKLYTSRDRNGTVHGMFYIDFFNLLKNNSQLFPYLSHRAQNAGTTVNEVLNFSRIIDLSLKRVRINNTYAVNGYEVFENDKVHELPIQTVACIQDISWRNAETTYTNIGQLEETSLASVKTSSSRFTRYFLFSDHNMFNQSAGSYQYQIELKFKDGTLTWLQEMLKNLMQRTTELEAYYKLSVSNINTGNLALIAPTGDKAPTAEGNVDIETMKKNFIPYYDSRSKQFRPEFKGVSDKMFTVNGDHISVNASRAIGEFIETFRPEVLLKERYRHILPGESEPLVSQDDLKLLVEKMYKLMGPGPVTGGSPEGILICLNILRQGCGEIRKIIGGIKKKSSNNSNELNLEARTDDFQQLPMQFYEVSGFGHRGLIEEVHTWDRPSEIFRTTENNDVYIDYLSKSPGHIAQWTPFQEKTASGDIIIHGRPVRRIDPQYFKDRCRADLAKYSSYATGAPGFFGSSLESSISPWLSPTSRRLVAGQEPDTFKRQLYSYLTPSVIELSDPTKSDVAWGFRYSAFDPDILSIIWDGDPGINKPVHSNGFFDHDAQESIWISLSNYAKNRNEFGYADLSEPYSLGTPSGAPEAAIIALPLRQREAFKSYFSKHNITVHKAGKHTQIFGPHSDIEPGLASAMKWLPPPEGGTLEPLNLADDYSDGLLLTNHVFAPIAAAAGSSAMSLPRGLSVPGGINWNSNPPKWFDLPNVYKMKLLWENFKEFKEHFGETNLATDFAHKDMISVLEKPQEHNATIFFNFNMVSKIEVFTGYEVNNLGSMAANDENGWTLLKEVHIDNLGTKSLFCRISFYNPKLVGHISSIPILDKYFIITNTEMGAWASSLVTDTEDDAVTKDVTGNIEVFEAENEEKVSEYASTDTNKKTTGQEETAAGTTSEQTTTDETGVPKDEGAPEPTGMEGYE